MHKSIRPVIVSNRDNPGGLVFARRQGETGHMVTSQTPEREEVVKVPHRDVTTRADVQHAVVCQPHP